MCKATHHVRSTCVLHALLASQSHLYIFLSETHCVCIEARPESGEIKPQVQYVLSRNEH